MKLPLTVLFAAILTFLFIHSASATVYNCVSCSDCNSKIAATVSWDVVQLTANINNQVGGCISFGGKDYITFDCLGNTIDGDDQLQLPYDYGIWLNNFDGGSNSNTIRNCVVTDFDHAIELESSQGNAITNVIANSNGMGITVENSSNTILTDITALSNGYGLYIDMSNYTRLTDVTANSNTGTGVWFFLSGYSTLRNITANSNNDGIYFDDSWSNQLTDITANSNTRYGIYLSPCPFTSITSATTNSNLWDGLVIDFSSNNRITNLTSSYNNRRGIYIRSTARDPSEYNVINNSRIEGNTQYGIYLLSNPSNSKYTRYNTFYNNYLNNTVNLGSDNENNTNRWNTTKDCTKTNIIGGPCIGGNYWTDPDGNFSDFCADVNGDKICDSIYSLDSNNTDYLPLASNNPPNTPPNITFASPTPANGTNATDNYIEVNVSLSEAPNACLLNWYSGTWANYTMAIQGLSCYRNMTNLPNYTYQFRVYANDSAGNTNVSETRQNGVSYSPPDTTPPVLVFVPPTPQNSTQTNQSWIFINASAGENLGSCILNWNDSNETFSPSGPSCTINKTSLSSGAYAFRMYASDSSGNWNSTETRYVTVNLSMPSISDYISISYGISPALLRTGSNAAISVNATTNGTLDRIVVRITPPGSATVMFVFTGNTTFNYTPSLLGVYNLSVFANTTRGYNQSVSGNFFAVDCINILNVNETMECGISIGECRKGNITCNNGAWGSTCEGAIGPQNETCNGKDDNCNGIIDDVKGGNSIQSTQCQCYNGGSPLASETCNGIDDNCNGLIDDNADCCTNDDTRPCGTALNLGICQPGISTCLNGTWATCQNAVTPQSKTCTNGLDNDCNGVIDSQEPACQSPNNASHCQNGVQDVDETGVDCGGNDCSPCQAPVNNTVSDHCQNGVQDADETGVDCGGECASCANYSIIWISISVIGAVILGVLLFMYFRLRKQGKELTWEELAKKWTPASQ